MQGRCQRFESANLHQGFGKENLSDPLTEVLRLRYNNPNRDTGGALQYWGAVCVFGTLTSEERLKVGR